MSVLIKIDMPKSCPCELVGVGYDLYCSFASGSPARVKEYDECCRNNTRPAWCPLSEVTAHGRLIDADKLREEMLLFIKENLLTRDDARELLATVDEAPTVIEAEGEER